MRDSFQSGPDKQRQAPNRRRQVLRGSLQAAITAFTLLNPESGAAETKTSVRPAVSAANNAANPWQPQLKRQPERAQRQQRPPAEEKLDRIGEYLNIIERMRNVRVESHGAPIRHPEYEKFCRELERQCEKFAHRRSDNRYNVFFSPEMYAQINSVNRRVNASVKAGKDIDVHGVPEKWTIPGVNGSGDCEDYVLTKFERFVELGFDPSTLHILTVFNAEGQGHAVLGVDVFVQASQAWNTLILDNAHDEVITLDEMEAKKKYKGEYVSFHVTHRNGAKPHVAFYQYRVERPSTQTVSGSSTGTPGR